MTYFVIGFCIYLFWAIACLFDKKKPDYSKRYYSKSKTQDHVGMLLLSTSLWPIFLIVMLLEFFDDFRSKAKEGKQYAKV